MNIYEQALSNRRATWAVSAVFVLLFLFIGFGFDYMYGTGPSVPIFTIGALILGIVSAFSSYEYGDRFILSSTHAQPLDLEDPAQKQWQNVVEEMSIAAGIPLPKTFIIEDQDPNAFATGKDPQHSSLVVTKGLLEALDRDEQQAVAAHEMSHIRNFDIRVMLMLSVLVGAVALISDWARRGIFRGSRRSGSRRQGQGNAALLLLAVWLVTIILAPLLSQLLAMCVSRKREYLADASGAELTRHPLALARALEKIDSRNEPTRSINQGTAHLCIADPKGRPLNAKQGLVADLLATHPPINRRIEALKQMAYVP